MTQLYLFFIFLVFSNIFGIWHRLFFGFFKYDTVLFFIFNETLEVLYSLHRKFELFFLIYIKYLYFKHDFLHIRMCFFLFLKKHLIYFKKNILHWFFFSKWFLLIQFFFIKYLKYFIWNTQSALNTFFSSLLSIFSNNIFFR